MTKAERIFNETRWNCRKHILDWPDETEIIGYSGVFYKENETISMRTINSIRKILESKKHSIEIDRKLGISTTDKLNLEEKILRMVEATINNSEQTINEWKDL